jgi:hypothetical protein
MKHLADISSFENIACGVVNSAPLLNAIFEVDNIERDANGMPVPTNKSKSDKLEAALNRPPILQKRTRSADDQSAKAVTGLTGQFVGGDASFIRQCALLCRAGANWSIIKAGMPLIDAANEHLTAAGKTRKIKQPTSKVDLSKFNLLIGPATKVLQGTSCDQLVADFIQYRNRIIAKRDEYAKQWEALAESYRSFYDAMMDAARTDSRTDPQRVTQTRIAEIHSTLRSKIEPLVTKMRQGHPVAPPTWDSLQTAFSDAFKYNRPAVKGKKLPPMEIDE